MSTHPKTLNDIYRDSCEKNSYYEEYLKEKCNFISTYDFKSNNIGDKFTIKQSDQNQMDSFNILIQKLNKDKPNLKLENGIQYSILNPRDTWLSFLKQVTADFKRVCIRVINGTQVDIDKITSFYNFYMGLKLENIKNANDLTTDTLIYILMSFNMLYNIFYSNIMTLIDESNETNQQILKLILSSNVILNPEPSQKLIYNKINYMLSVLFSLTQQSLLPFSLYTADIQNTLIETHGKIIYNYIYSRIFDIKNKQIVSTASYVLKGKKMCSFIISCSVFNNIRITKNESEMKFLNYIDVMFDLVPFISLEVKEFINKDTPKPQEVRDFIRAMIEYTSVDFSLWSKEIVDAIPVHLDLYQLMIYFMHHQIAKNPAYNPCNSNLESNRLLPLATVKLSPKRKLSPRLESLFSSPKYPSPPRTVSSVRGGKYKYKRLKKKWTKKSSRK